MKRYIAIAVGVVAALSLSASVASAAPTATGDVTLQPQGNIYKQVAKPVNVTFHATISPGAGEATLDPLMESRVDLPQGLRFVPDPKMPKCSFTEAQANVPSDTALAHCPKSVVGNGKADLYIAQSVAAHITDPRIIIFNAGNGKIVIQAYSSSTNAGITFGGGIKNGVLDLKIPRLTYDSSVPSYTLSIPGKPLPAVVGPPPADAIPAGSDKGFAQATCAKGNWDTQTTLFLGDRDASGNVSNTSTVKAPKVAHSCKGLKGKPKFAKLKVKGPKKVKAGKKAKFKVKIKNKGTATAKKVKVIAKGAGKGKKKINKIKPGQTKTVKVKTRVKGKKGKKVTVKFKAKAKNKANASGKTKVKLK